MTAVELPLSEYVLELSVSNKRRYLEKISSEIDQDPLLLLLLLLVILCRPLLEYSAQVTTYIQVYKLNNCYPYLIPASELRNGDFPPVTNTDIFNYLVLGHSFCTSQRFKSHKSLDAFKYFLCGFVKYLGSKRFDGKYAAIAKVH